MHPYHIPHFPPTIVEVKDFPLLFSKIDLLRRRRRFDTGNHRQWLVGWLSSPKRKRKFVARPSSLPPRRFLINGTMLHSSTNFSKGGALEFPTNERKKNKFIDLQIVFWRRFVANCVCSSQCENESRLMTGCLCGRHRQSCGIFVTLFLFFGFGETTGCAHTRYLNFRRREKQAQIERVWFVHRLVKNTTRRWEKMSWGHHAREEVWMEATAKYEKEDPTNDSHQSKPTNDYVNLFVKLRVV